MESSFLREALDRLKFISWQITQASGSDRLALEGARRELVEMIAVAMSQGGGIEIRSH